MDIISALSGIAAAFGLSTSAGLNAYIPLLLVALAARFPTNSPLLNLSEPYDVMGNSWVILVLAILLIIEMTVDKIPAVDSVNDVIQTLIRPVAGAVLFAANAQVITDLSPIIAIIAGLILAGSVHGTKGLIRPAVTATTAGTGNWLVSIIEDVIAVVVSVLSIIIAPLAVALFLILAYVIFRWYRRRNTPKFSF